MMVIEELARLAGPNARHTCHMVGDAGRASERLEFRIAKGWSGVEHQHGGAESVQVHCQIEIVPQHHLGYGANAKVDVAAGGQQDLQQSHRVRCPARAGNGHNDVAFHRNQGLGTRD